MNCPNCNQKLYKNKYEDMVCPTCGIIIYHEEKDEEDYKENKNYIG